MLNKYCFFISERSLVFLFFYYLCFRIIDVYYGVKVMMVSDLEVRELVG